MRERTITVEGLRIRAIEILPEAERDEPVLLVHGLAGWAENWRYVMPAIAETGRRVVAMDLPGFGQSERPRRPRYFDPEAPFYARSAFGVLDALGIARAHVAGHSFGGAIAFTSAVWCPERVRSLTLVAPAGLGGELAQNFRLLTLPGMGLLARLRTTPSIARAVLYSCFHDPSSCPEELVTEAVRYGPLTAGEMVSVLRATVSFTRGVRDEVRGPWVERRERYQGPALIVWGREDAILPSSLVGDARRLAPQAEVRVIPSCGHLVMAERPREFLDAFLPFLDRASAVTQVPSPRQPNWRRSPDANA